MLNQGITGRKSQTVTDDLTAASWGSGELPVYATPAMVLLIEETASRSVDPYLEEGETTVGTWVDVRHVSATPVGMEVVCETELVEVDRARLRFKVTVSDAFGGVGTGYHERFVVRKEKFMAKALSKLE